MTKENKTLRIVIDVILIILGIVFLVFGIKDAVDYYNSAKVSDNVRFSKSYPDVGNDNPYEYIDTKEANEIIQKGSGIIFLGHPNDPWCQVLIKHLTSIFSDKNIDTVYYLDMDADFNVEELHIELKDTVVPHIVIVENGTIVKEVSKRDMIDEEYDGIPIEYFEEELSLVRLKDALKDIKK